MLKIHTFTFLYLIFSAHIFSMEGKSSAQNGQTRRF